MQSQQLLTESEIFKDESPSGPESTDSPSQKMTERCDDGQNHGQNLIERRPIKPVSKPFILRVHEVFTRDNLVVSNHDPYSSHAEKKSQWLLFHFLS